MTEKLCGTCAHRDENPLMGPCRGCYRYARWEPVDDLPAADYLPADFVPVSAPDMTLPADSAERKEYPIYSGVLRYFPAALAGVARHSKLGNDKHNPGEPLHHARGKSMDHEDCILRHLVDLSDLLARRERMVFTHRGEREMAEQILTEANALAWRALALAQRLHEQIGGAPLAPGAVER
ncbi:MAG: hypothetical protein LC121_23580 [Anaerolineae bacterium]|nr:hypothetical protein [Anaerolineae bacterium]